MLRYVVLGLLRDGAPRHGYALTKAYRDRVGVQVSTGSFYREFQRLEQDGLIRSVTRPSDGDPRRLPYEITPAGATAFNAWFRDLNSVPFAGGCPEDQLSARVLFLAVVAPADALFVLESWQAELFIRAKMLERSRDAALAAARRAGPGKFPTLPFLLARRLRHVAADVAAVEDLRATFEGWLEAAPRDRKAGAETAVPVPLRPAPATRRSVRGGRMAPETSGSNP